MKPAATVPKKATDPARRRAGRRPRSDAPGGELSRDAVIRCAIDLAQRASIAEVSMVRVAREMDVAPGLIHYYVGSKDDLLSAVLNVAFRERVLALPPVTGDWRADLEGVCRSWLATLARWPGSANYFATHNRFRLFQRVAAGEIDYGLVFFDHVGRILQNAGFTSAQAALVFDLTAMFITSNSLEAANKQAPENHRDFIIDHVSRYERKDVPGATFLVGPFTKIGDEKRLSTGLKLLLDGFEGWLKPPPDTRAPRRGTR
ncbi:MAG: TetR/AcrR family transcriptional regulator C-terminal domain-containing protein [Pseudorhodoferax sp.]